VGLPVFRLAKFNNPDKTGDTKDESNCAAKPMRPFSGAVMVWSGNKGTCRKIKH
jgi:hypothetical protein